MSDLSHIPTPETVSVDAKQVARSWESSYWNMRDHARDLERRLTVAREAITELDSELKRQGFTIGGTLRIMTHNALTITAPKP